MFDDIELAHMSINMVFCSLLVPATAVATADGLTNMHGAGA